MDRVDIGQAVLCIAVLAVMTLLVFYGPPDHRATVAAALVGALTTGVAALRGRMVKRDASQFEKKEGES